MEPNKRRRLLVGDEVDDGGDLLAQGIPHARPLAD